MIELSHIHVAFKANTPLEKSVLHDLNLTIQAGHFVTLIGSNGAGKSTLLAALAGDIKPQKGQIFINGRDVTQHNSTQRAPFIARVFQDPLKGSCGALSLEENLALASLRGKKSYLGAALTKAKRAQFRDLVAQLGIGLENHLAQPMASFSGGQRQALCLLMAVMAKADLLLLDEHTAALDPAMADFVMELTQKIVHEKKLTTLMVTHSMRQALRYGDRLLMLHGGEIIFDAEGAQRQQLRVGDLLRKFQAIRGIELDDDQLLMD